MIEFETFFGLKESQIRPNCILIPFLPKGLLSNFGIKKLNKGLFYSAANSRDFTLIHTGTGHQRLGDAVLYLENSPCRNLMLFGACGLTGPIDRFDIGSLVCPSQCYALESFTHLLLKDLEFYKIGYPSPSLTKQLVESPFDGDIPSVTAATFGSLKLEESYLDFLDEYNVDVVDMECSAFYHAAKAIGRNAVALLFVTDIIGKVPFHAALLGEHKKTINTAVEKGSEILKELTKRLAGD